jgi:hypothetical protein
MIDRSPTGSASTESPGLPSPAPCRHLRASAAFGWLRLGWRDLVAAHELSLLYGLLFASFGTVLALLTWRLGLLALYWAGQWLRVRRPISGNGPVFHQLPAAAQRQTDAALQSSRRSRASARYAGTGNLSVAFTARIRTSRHDHERLTTERRGAEHARSPALPFRRNTRRGVFPRDGVLRDCFFSAHTVGSPY